MQAERSPQLAALAAHFAERQEAILEAWRESSRSDPNQTTVGFLTRSQFNDHIPKLLDAFQRRLGTGSSPTDETKSQEVKHGLQRWQQGYRLTELVHEWGHLNRILFREIKEFAAAHPEIAPAAFTEAYAELIDLIGEGVAESTAQYDRMQQAEAAGRLADLKGALAEITRVDHRRAELIHQAVHDLRTNLQSVSTAAEVLLNTGIPEAERTDFAHLVQHELDSVGSMLVDLMALARLEAGQERRDLAPFDGAHLLQDMAAAARPVAAGLNLFVKTEGPASLMVQGDAAKVRRIVQNLISNALKYTESGGLTLSWGSTEARWWIIVQDTGPGLRSGPNSPLADNLTVATDSARESEKGVPGANHVLPIPPGGSSRSKRSVHPPGEGIGLSIVKRLCELLDASIELTSSAHAGTTFRVVLPRRY